jgi:hypothetical protein
VPRRNAFADKIIHVITSAAVLNTLFLYGLGPEQHRPRAQAMASPLQRVWKRKKPDGNIRHDREPFSGSVLPSRTSIIDGIYILVYTLPLIPEQKVARQYTRHKYLDSSRRTPRSFPNDVRKSKDSLDRSMRSVDAKSFSTSV